MNNAEEKKLEEEKTHNADNPESIPLPNFCDLSAIKTYLIKNLGQKKFEKAFSILQKYEKDIGIEEM